MYNKYISYIKIKKDEQELTKLYSVLHSLMETYKRDISFDEYRLSVLVKYPDLKDLLLQIEHSQIADDVLQSSVETLVERSLAHELALVSIDVSEGRKEASAILDFYDKFKEKEKYEEIVYVTDNLEDIYNETLHEPGLRWRLPTLNRMLGSLRKGDFGFIFARPETGKTTFLASEVTYFASQTKSEILWFNNEEQGSKVKVRCYQAALACELSKLYADRIRAQQVYLERTGGKIKIYDSASIHRKQVESICKEVNPSLIIFDQIDKIRGFDNDRKDLQLGDVYIWARELAKKYCPVIGVSQADATGEGKKWLDMGNVSNAKTSKQAEADWILGIGAVHDIGLEHIRYLHLSKNKLTGDEDSIPALRHGKCEVVIKPNIARYAEFGG
jgi:replicative DNA helicase